MLTVLALDAIELGTGGSKVTFHATGTRNGRRAKPSVPDPVYDYKGQPWHNPAFPATKAVVFDKLTKAQRRIDVLIVTATDTEIRQVLRLLRPPARHAFVIQTTKDLETYYLGRYGRFRAAVVRCTMGVDGPSGATLGTSAALSLLRPRAVVMVGIAFGSNKSRQFPGDTLVASEVVPYEHQRIGKFKVDFRAPIPPSGPTLFNRFQNAMGWTFTRPDGTRVTVQTGAILSGSKLVDNPKFKKQLLSSNANAIGGEMEAAGVWAAAARNRVEWAIVKSVCDWGDGKKHDGYQELAAASAASLVEFVFSQPTALDGL